MRIKVRAAGLGKIDFETTDGATVGDLLEQLFHRHPDALHRFRNSETGKIYSYVNVWVNSRSIKQLAGVETKLRKDDVLTLFLPSAGG